MSPPTVNAYYNPNLNEIVFPAGILQPPFFDPKADDAVNYGGIGMVIGHELTHGFDDQGRKYDAAGNLREWWLPQDEQRYKERAALVSSQYGGYVAVDDLKINGQLTLGENIADLGGLKIACVALQKALKDRPGRRRLPAIRRSSGSSWPMRKSGGARSARSAAADGADQPAFACAVSRARAAVQHAGVLQGV